MKTLQIFFLLFLTICLSGCYQRFYYELKSDHLLVSAVDGRSYSKLSMSKTESDFDKICEKHKLNLSEKYSLWGYNSILWINGKKHRSISVYAVSKKHTTITWQCPKFCAHFILTDYQNHVRFVYYITKIPFYKRDIDEFPILS